MSAGKYLRGHGVCESAAQMRPHQRRSFPRLSDPHTGFLLSRGRVPSLSPVRPRRPSRDTTAFPDQRVLLHCILHPRTLAPCMAQECAGARRSVGVHAGLETLLYQTDRSVLVQRLYHQARMCLVRSYHIDPCRQIRALFFGARDFNRGPSSIENAITRGGEWIMTSSTAESTRKSNRTRHWWMRHVLKKTACEHKNQTPDLAQSRGGVRAE